VEVEVEPGAIELGGGTPRRPVLFRDRAGAEVGRITLYWLQGKLYAKFKGSREAAERLASAIKSLGGEAEARQYGGRWYVVMTTNQILEIKDRGWVEAVRGFVEGLYRGGIIDEAKYRSLLERLEEGGAAPELAGVRFGVGLDRSRGLAVVHKPKSGARFAEAVRRLREYGLEEGLHFTAGRAPSGRYYVRLTRLGLAEVARRAGLGDAEAARFLKALGERARRLGAREEALPSPAVRRLPIGLNAGGVAVVIKSVAAEMVQGAGPARLRISAEYEAGGAAGRLSITYRWERTTGGLAARADVRVADPVKAAVLKALVGEYSVSAGRAKLFMRHLERLRELEGVAEAVDAWLKTKGGAARRS
jgi:hypothetical protein